MEEKVPAARPFAAALRGLPKAEIKAVNPQNRHTRIQLDVAGRRYEVKAVWVGNGWPSEVRKALDALRGSAPSEFVFTAKRFSPGALITLEEHAANWADESGQARIVIAPGLLIVRDHARPEEEQAPQVVRWPPSGIEIAEFVLHNRMTELQTGSLADQTKWSAAQVSKVLKMFDSLGWTEKRGGKSGRAARREVVSPGSLLDAWASHASKQRHRKRLGHVTSRDLLRFAHTELRDRLGREEYNWAVTTWGGLEITTPFATLVPALHIYTAGELFDTRLEEVMREAGIREVDEGARVEFWAADFRILVQRGEPSSIPVISRPRLYADLLALGGRGAEGAEHYRETALGI